MNRRLVYDIGVNDAKYSVRANSLLGRVLCPYYRKWSGMLQRCYDNSRKFEGNTYQDCRVCDDWLVFTNFKSWMEKQDWQEKELDKDIINKGNKIYSPDNCSFVDKMTNMFIVDRLAARGKFLIGTHYDRSRNSFQSRCRNPFSKKQEHLGYFSCEKDAHNAWRKRKHELACQLADLQSDIRVSVALRNWFQSDEKSSS